MEKDSNFIRQDIDYEKLKAYQKAECVYDILNYSEYCDNVDNAVRCVIERID